MIKLTNAANLESWLSALETFFDDCRIELNIKQAFWLKGNQVREDEILLCNLTDNVMVSVINNSIEAELRQSMMLPRYGDYQHDNSVTLLARVFSRLSIETTAQEVEVAVHNLRYREDQQYVMIQKLKLVKMSINLANLDVDEARLGDMIIKLNELLPAHIIGFWKIFPKDKKKLGGLIDLLKDNDRLWDKQSKLNVNNVNANNKRWVKDRSKITCFNCGELGHKSFECKVTQSNGNDNGDIQEHDISHETNLDEENGINRKPKKSPKINNINICKNININSNRLDEHYSLAKIHDTQNRLMLDTGADGNIFSNKNFFTSLTLGEVKDVNVTTANEQNIEVLGKGTFHLLIDGKEYEYEAYYVPSLNVNILSTYDLLNKDSLNINLRPNCEGYAMISKKNLSSGIKFKYLGRLLYSAQTVDDDEEQASNR